MIEWGVFCVDGVIRTFYFETDEETAVTVNREGKRDMMYTQLWLKLEELETDNFWCQQDGATCHTSRETLALFHEKFPERVIF